MQLPINTLGTNNSILHKPAKMVTKEDLTEGVYDSFIKNLVDTAANLPNCVGLAANQVWTSTELSPPAIFAIKGDTSDTEGNVGWGVFINPVIRPTGRSYKEYEGCMSIPRLSHLKRRHKNVAIIWMDENNNLYSQKYGGFYARIIQHEYDHLCGKTLVNKRPIRRKNKKK
tara:strand:+ start:94 stop:606 length:513 start_codon:yes stop_codon:yes gene_type:complete